MKTTSDFLYTKGIPSDTTIGIEGDILLTDLLEEYASHPSPMSAEQVDWRQVIKDRVKHFNSIFHSYEARQLVGALYAIDQLVPPSHFAPSPPAKPMSAEQVEELGYYYPLFKFFSDEHGLSLLDSQLQDVIHECKKFIEPATTGENWKTEYDNCRALLQELVSLKVMRENLYKGNPDGKEYAERKPKAWQAAQQFLSTYQHEGLSTTPSVKADGWVSVEDGLPECNEKFGDSDYYSCKDENSSGTPFVAWYNNKTNVWKLAHHAVPNISVNVTHYRSL